MNYTKPVLGAVIAAYLAVSSAVADTPRNSMFTNITPFKRPIEEGDKILPAAEYVVYEKETGFLAVPDYSQVQEQCPAFISGISHLDLKRRKAGSAGIALSVIAAAAGAAAIAKGSSDSSPKTAVLGQAAVLAGAGILTHQILGAAKNSTLYKRVNVANLMVGSYNAAAEKRNKELIASGILNKVKGPARGSWKYRGKVTLENLARIDELTWKLNEHCHPYVSAETAAAADRLYTRLRNLTGGKRTHWEKLANDEIADELDAVEYGQLYMSGWKDHEISSLRDVSAESSKEFELAKPRIKNIKRLFSQYSLEKQLARWPHGNGEYRARLVYFTEREDELLGVLKQCALEKNYSRIDELIIEREKELMEESRLARF